MFNQWPCIYQLGKWLNDEWKGAFLVRCFSRSKNIIYFEFEKNKQTLHIKFEFNKYGSFISKEFSHPKNTDINQFNSLIGLSISEVLYLNNERSIQIRIGTYDLLWIKFYGSLGNILWYHNNELIQQFKLNIINDQSANPNLIQNNTIQEPKPNSFAVKLLPSQHNFQIVFDTGNGRTQLLYTTHDILDALSNFSKYYLRKRYAYERNLQKISTINQSIKKTIKNISNCQNRLESIKNERPLDEIGHIIVANIHQINPNANHVLLDDFYHNQKLYVKLNPLLNAQQNAETYFRKSKNRRIEVEHLNNLIKSSNENLKKLEHELQVLSDHIYDEPKETKKSVINKKTEIPGIKNIQLNDYTIYIGKNSEANDKLTLKIASKNDLWFHAYGVSGSHVVIKTKANQTTPDNIIKKAAQLAAYHSKNKNSILVPVIKTYVKYVHKPRGANPGQVKVDRYDILDVSPSEE